jgi:hypothetical protein
MIPRPVAANLILCDLAIVEKGTEKVSLIGCFRTIYRDQFPSLPRAFTAFSVLSGGWKDGSIELRVSRSENQQVVYRKRGQITFADRSAVIFANIPTKSCSFPDPGRYLFELLVDDEIIAERFVNVELLG